MIWTGLRRGKLKRETEFLLIAAQNNTNWIKVKIDNTRQNRKCRLCGDRDEAVNYMINECSKLAQKEYKIRHDWVGKVIHWELCKRLIWPYYQYQYMHKLQFVQENEIHKILWDFEIQMEDYLIPARRPNLVLVNKKRKGLAI